MAEERKKFTCPRCGASTDLKANLTCHLRSKTPCDTKFSSISREDVLKSLQKERKLPCVECVHCKKTVCTKSIKRHLSVCSNKPDKPQPEQSNNTGHTVEDERDSRLLNKLIDIIQREFKDLRGQALNNVYQTINNVVSNTININVNQFGNETLSHLTMDFLSHCLMNPTKGITKLIENIHYNDDVPENKNIRFKSNKNNTFEKYSDEQWIECDASNTLDELIKRGYRVLSKHYADNYMDNPEYDDDVRRQAIEKFRFLADTSCPQYCSIKRDVRLLIKNKTCYIVAYPGSIHNSDVHDAELVSTGTGSG